MFKGADPNEVVQSAECLNVNHLTGAERRVAIE